jgi:hypothetical protein
MINSFDANNPQPRWSMPGLSIYRQDDPEAEWRLVTRYADVPCKEALWLYRSLLLTIPETSFYEWTEDGVRFRMERWSAAALEVARKQYPMLFEQR